MKYLIILAFAFVTSISFATSTTQKLGVSVKCEGLETSRIYKSFMVEIKADGSICTISHVSATAYSSSELASYRKKDSEFCEEQKREAGSRNIQCMSIPFFASAYSIYTHESWTLKCANSVKSVTNKFFGDDAECVVLDVTHVEEQEQRQQHAQREQQQQQKAQTNY